MNRTLIIAGVAVALLIGIAALLAESPSAREQVAKMNRDESKTVLALFDLSGSARDMQEVYNAAFTRIIDGLGPGDRIVVERISDRPLNEATFPVNELFEKYGAFDRRSSPVYAPANERDLAAKKDEIKETVRAFIAGNGGSGTTAIIDSMLLAEQVFTTYPSPQRVLFVFSDMVEIHGGNNFLRDGLTDASIGRIMDDLRESDRLSDLHGVTVYVVGAGAGGDNRKVKATQWFDIKRFWLRFFAEAGATLTENHYGASLLEI
jgi:hypothetical protein